jgi:hypothetical protein
MSRCYWVPLLVAVCVFAACGRNNPDKSQEEDEETRLVREVVNQYLVVIGRGGDVADARILMTDEYARVKAGGLGLGFPIADHSVGTVEVFKAHNQASAKGSLKSRGMFPGDSGATYSFSVLLNKDGSNWKVASFSHRLTSGAAPKFKTTVTPTWIPPRTWVPTPDPTFWPPKTPPVTPFPRKSAT